MAGTLAPLRRNLDLMPSPLPDRPGLLIRDPYGYAGATLVIPPPLVGFLRFFDGEHTDLDLRQALVHATGQLQVGEILEQLVGTLADGAFLDDEAYARVREARHREFAAAPAREASHAGGAYPAEAEPLREALRGYFEAPETPAPPAQDLLGIAAPHVSFEGGHASYAAAYSCLAPSLRDRTFVILGTSHYGQPDRFGLTRKTFRTPLGEAGVDLGIVDRLAAAAPEAVEVEDYCHAIEHSIEFQVVFLQHVLGAQPRVVPILCGPFAGALLGGGRPEDARDVGLFLDALAELQAREGRRLVWVLGVDLAHVGRRYGDRYGVRADKGRMRAVAERDHERLARAAAGDAAGFWELVRQDGDDLRWCGSSALYAFLRALAPKGGELLRYQQWNIDAESVVSFAGMAFRH